MDLAGDVRFSVRSLIKNPGFTAVAIATLAIGIGVNAAVFTVTNAVLFRGFPHVDPNNRILYVATNRGVSYPDFEDWKAQTKSFRELAVVANGGLRLLLNDRTSTPEACDGTELSANSFQVLGQPPILGRDFTASDETPGAPAVAILAYEFWQRRYAKDSSIVGKNIRLNGSPTTVIGIMPPSFYFPHRRVDLWVPLVPAPTLQKRETRALWFAFGRIADGVTLRSAQTEIETIGSRLESAYPLTNRDVHPHVMNFHEALIGPNAAAFYGAIWGTVGFVLLIACANLANLQLGRAMGRSREISVRIALGASRRRIIRQLLIESWMLSSVGGVFGWLIALAGVRTYQLLANPPRAYDHWDYALDYRVFLYLVAISAATGLLFGLAPALRLSKLDINTTLKNSSRGTTPGANPKSLSALLVTTEMALAVILLAGAGLMTRSFLNLYHADLGAQAANILTASLRLPVARYSGPQAQIAFFEQLAAHLNDIPGVDSVAITDSLPGLYAPRLPYEIVGSPALDERRRPTLRALAIGPDYFRTLGAAVLSGRQFDDFDRASGVPAVIVNQLLAKQLWPGENALGKHLTLLDKNTTEDAWRTVVGVASNIAQWDQANGQSLEPTAYIPFRQRPAAEMDVVARTRVPPENLVSAFRHEIQAMDSELVIYSGLGSIEGPKPLTESLAFNYWASGVNAGLFLVFAAIALLLAVVGLYAVVAHSVSQKTQEIGIRMAVGATARDIARLVFVQGMVPSGIGLAVGLAGSFAVTRVLKSELVRVSPADPTTLAVACGVLVLSALLGCWIPARRATRVDPMAALRHD